MNFLKTYTSKYFIALTFLIALTSCGDKTAQQEISTEEHHDESPNTVEFTKAQFTNAGIELGMIEHKQISGTIKVNGVLDVPPQNLVSISTMMGGFLKDTKLLQGLHVQKGQLIAKIENLDFIQLQQDFLEAKSQLELSKADYERQQQLASESVNSGKVLQQAKTTYVTWQAKHSGLSEKLKVLGINPATVTETNLTSFINLYSPIDGYVTQVNVNIGKYVNPTDVLFEIVDTEHLHAELIVFEKDVRKLKIGQKVRFTLANESKERIATVYLIGREISANRTIQIHCHIDEEDKDLLPGMYLQAAVETGGAEVAALPDAAIIDFQGTKYIFVAREEEHEKEKEHKTEEGIHFSMVEIKIGASELGYTAVIVPENIRATSKIVVTGAYALLSKIKNSEEEGGHQH